MHVRQLLLANYLLFTLLLLFPVAIHAQGGGLLQDGGFDGFYASGDGSSGVWKPFKLSTPGPVISKHALEGWPRGPSLHIYGDAIQFDGGVYQVVGVTPGKGYHFEVQWAVVSYGGVGMTESKVIRQVGIDPYGGTDPRSSNIVWSGEYRGSGKCARPCPADLGVDAHARSDKITVFLRARSEYTDSHVDVYFDSAGLQENGAPPIVVAPPTATPAPQPTARPATATPIRTRVAAAATATPTATAAPTETREPTATRTPRATIVPPAEESSTAMPTLTLFILGAGCLFFAMLALGGIGFFLLVKRT